MQDKTNIEFDSFVRSMMENAQEQAPDGIWESIESRLPQPRKAPMAWWQWAGIGLAAAAAALGAIFISRPADNAVPAVSSVSPVVAESVVEVAPVTTVIEAPEEITSTYIAMSAPVKTQAVPLAEPEEDVQVPVQKEIIAEEQVVSQAIAPEAVREESVEAYTVNPFATIEEPSTRRIKSQLQLNGLVGSNDGNPTSLFNNPIRMGAPTLSSPASPISETTESNYAIPMTFGIGMRVYLNDNLSLGTGVNFSLLSRTFSGSYMGGPTSDISHSLKYIGIPVNIYYDLLKSDFIKVYSFVGGAAEKAISNSFVIKSGSDPVTYSEKVNGLQWSANLGLGVQFNLSNNIGLFLDPSARYYFDCNQPKSIRTKNNYMFGFEAGLRFDL